MKTSKDVSIEYAHIYTNKKISEEQELSLQLLGEIYKDKDKQSLVVMVDDYSFPDPLFDYEQFSLWLTEKGYKPDFMIRESQLIPLCDELLKTQLGLIEKKITTLRSNVASIEESQPDVKEALAYVEEFLLAPSTMWQKAGISSRIRLQWFQFPSGITFDGEKFGTAEVASVFKAKQAFSSQKTNQVHLP